MPTAHRQLSQDILQEERQKGQGREQQQSMVPCQPMYGNSDCKMHCNMVEMNPPIKVRPSPFIQWQ